MSSSEEFGAEKLNCKAWLTYRILDMESQVLLKAANNGELYRNVLEKVEREDKIKRGTLVDRKRHLIKIGVISEETLKSEYPSKGRPKKRLFMNTANKKRLMSLFNE